MRKPEKKISRLATVTNLAFLNGKVLTLDSRRPTAQAILVEHGQITKVGTNQQALGFAPRDAQIIDLNGATVLPGFTDCHTHLVAYGLELFGANLRKVRSIHELHTILARHARRLGPGKWLLGYGWDQEKLKERRFPNRHDLDAAVPDRPVCLFRICGHMCLGNSEALRLANITAATTPPIGGVIDRERDTLEPSGLLRESAMDLVTSVIPAHTDDDVRRAATLAMQKTVSAGLTGVHCVIDQPQHLRVLHAMNRAGELKVRIYVLIPASWLSSAAKMGISTGFGDGMLRIQAVKIFTDGSLGARTAALEEPYSDAPETSGVVIHPQDELNELVESAARHGLQVAVHAIGDRAVSMALKAIENANHAVQNSSTLRHRIEHVSVLNKNLIERMAKCQFIASVQPHFKPSDPWVPERVGPERARLVYALKTIAENATMTIGGSDCPVEPIAPLEGIYAATAPIAKDYGEQVDSQTAVEMFTKNAAYATFEEKVRGTIQVGKAADLVVLDRNPLLVPPEEVRRIRVLATLVGGKLAYRSNRFSVEPISSVRRRRAQ